jgi:hypothetical protein
MYLNFHDSDKRWIISRSLELVRKIEEKMDDRQISSALSGADKLDFLYDADDYFAIFDQEPLVFKKFLEEPERSISSEYDSERDIFQMLYDEFLTFIFYLLLWRKSGRKIRKFQGSKDYNNALEYAYTLIGQCKTLTLPKCIVSFIKSHIDALIDAASRGKISLGDPCLLLLSQIAIATEPYCQENITLIEELNISAKTRYHYYQLIDKSRGIPMEKFLLEILPLEYCHYAVESLSMFQLSSLIPNILASHLSWDFTRRFKEIECLKYIGRPEHELVCQFLESTVTQDIQAKAVIFATLFDRMQAEQDNQILELYTLLVFYDACYQSRDLIISQKPEWLPGITDRVNKFLALLRTPGRINIPPLKYDLSILCAYYAALFLKNQYPLWKVIKPLTLALRFSEKPYVDSTLKIKKWSGPEMESNLAAITARIVVNFRQTEDEEPVRKLRRDMANGLIDMLKPLPKGKPSKDRRNHFSHEVQSREGFDIALVEPDPNQRYYILHAIADLGVSTDGAGHYFFAALEKISRNDLSSKVRDMAKKVIKRLESLRGGWAPGSHERRVLLALWWLRLAHALSVSVISDGDMEKAWASRSSEYTDILAIEEGE